MTEEAVKEILENLVGKRFNITTLNEYLFKAFKLEKYIELADVSREDDELCDYNLMGCLDAHGIFCDFDIYFLKMRMRGWDDSLFYVTEVGYEFQ